MKGQAFLSRLNYMKKIAIILILPLFLLVILGFFGVGFDSAEAYWDAGCNKGGPYSILTGLYCDGSQYGNPQYSSYGSQYGTPYNYNYYNNYSYPYNYNSLPQYQYQNQYYPQYSPLLSSAAYSTQTFMIGSRGTEIARLQQFLRDQGYYMVAVDGVYGPITAGALQSYQTNSSSQIPVIYSSAPNSYGYTTTQTTYPGY